MRNFIKQLDMSESEVSLRFQKDTVHKTFIGGLLSIVQFLLCLILFYIFGLDMFHKMNPQVLTDTIVDIDNATLNLNDPLFNIVMQPYNFIPESKGNEYHYNSSIINLMVWKMNYIQFKNGTKVEQFIPLELKKCEIGDFHETHREFFNTNQFASNRPGLCLKNKNLTLQGQYSSPLFTFLRIKVSECNGIDFVTGQPVICEKREKIQEIISNYKFSIYFTHAIPLYSDYDTPYSSQVYNTGYSFNNELHSKDNYFFSRDRIITDDSWFSPINDNLFEFTNFITPQPSTATTKDAYLKLYVRVEPSYSSSRRIYKKIPDILAEVLSIIQIAHLGFQFALSYFGKISFIASLINFYFYDENRKGEKILHYLKENKFKNNNSVNINKSLLSSNMNIANSNNHMLNNFLNNKSILENKSLNNNFENIIGVPPSPGKNSLIREENTKNLNKPRINSNSIKKSLPNQNNTLIPFQVAFLCCFCKTKYQIYKNLKKRIESKLEITNYLDTLEEIKLLKHMMLNKSQIDLLHLVINYHLFKHGTELTSDWLKSDGTDEKSIIESIKYLKDISSENMEKKNKILQSRLNNLLI